jgi:energy-coupling factor transporter ATP-binding protein EcfA2
VNKFIQKVKIDGLWNTTDIEINFNTHHKNNVTALIGKNGSGKSTIIDLIEFSLSDEKNIHNIDKYDFKSIEVTNISGNTTRVAKPNKIETNLENIDEVLKLLDSLRDDIAKNRIGENRNIEEQNLFNKTIKISTFDLEQQDSVPSFMKNSKIKTELDEILYGLITQFKSYHLTLKKEIDKLNREFDEKLKDVENEQIRDFLLQKQEKQEEIEDKKKRFIETIEYFFQNKRLDFDEDNSIVFKVENQRYIEPHQLSSGEKQLLVIFLTLVLNINRPLILLLDEPEISMHVEWQKNLIKKLISLHDDLQLFIVTHSPAIVMSGWKDKVIKLEDLLKVK